MILEIFKDAFGYSFKDNKQIIKLGLINLFTNLFIFPMIFLEGYSYRIITIGVNGIINGDDPLPDFHDLGDMFIDGLKVVIVKFLYLLPGTIIAIFFFGYNIASIGNYGTNITTNVTDITSYFPPELFKNFIFTGGFIGIAILLWIIFYILSDIAITNMAFNNGNIKDAFKFKDIFEIIKAINVSKFIISYVGMIILFTGITITLFLILIIFQMILATLMSLLTLTYVVSFVLSGLFMGILTIVLFTFIITPFFINFKSRLISLIYNMR